MDGFSDESVGGRLPADIGAEPQAPPDLGGLLNYPALWHLVDGTDALALEEMHERLRRTSTELERVTHESSAGEASRAAKAALAYRATLSLIGELTVLRKTSAES
jgi:hypothetical protein